MVISTAKFPPFRIAVCDRDWVSVDFTANFTFAAVSGHFAKEQPFCRLLAGRDLGELACANSPELDAALKTATQQKPM